MPKNRFIHKYIALITAALVLLSSCAGNAPENTAAPVSETTVSETMDEAADTTEASESSASETSVTEADAPETSESTEDTAAETDEAAEQSEADTSAGDDTAETDGTEDTEDAYGSETTEEAAEQSDESTDTESTPTAAPIAQTTTASQTSATTQTTTTAQTTAQTTTTPPTTTAAQTTVKHDPAPPVINKISSDGVNVFECEKGIIDYSNANSGYISAKYTGAKDNAKVRITCGDVNYDYTIYPDGKYHYFTLSTGNGDYSAKMFEHAGGKMYSDVIGGKFTVKISDEVKMYTFASEYIYFDENSDCVAKASEICGGCSNDIEKISAVFQYVAENISYDYELAATVKSFYVPDPDKTLKTKKGVCFDYSSLLAAMLRSQGIPTRLLIGYAIDNIYHAWNEVYTEETGWITLEIFLKNKGFNLLDSTFYSTSNDKKWIADLMSNKSSYSKIYTY